MKHLMPMAMGAVMGMMMLVMSHTSIANGQLGGATTLFILAHVALIGGALTLGRWFGLRWPANWHRPNPQHLMVMVAATGLTAFTIHLFHGGPA